MNKNNLNRDDFVMVRVHKNEKAKLKKLREKHTIRDNPKMFRELLRKAKV
jgi:hypothetical protein